MIEVGKKAPDFTLENQKGETVTLSDLKGKRVLLSWHPLAFTSVCTAQMLDLQLAGDELDELNTVALGLSVDAVPAKAAWAQCIGLSDLQILADFEPKGEVTRAYDLYDAEGGTSVRANVLVDEDGKVAWAKEYPLTQRPDLDEVLEVLKG